jgi:hypothetical protein
MITMQDAELVLKFLEKIQGHGYGGMSDYDVALQIMRDLVESKK